jgi:hypothetical protein
MDWECEHASILGKKMSPFGRSRNGDIQFFSVFPYLWATLYTIKADVEFGLLNDLILTFDS